MKRICTLCAVLAFLCACAKPGLTPHLVKTVPDQETVRHMATKVDENPAALSQALDDSLAYIRSRPTGKKPFVASGLEHTWADVAATLEHLKELLPRLKTEPQILSRDFDWYEVRPRPLMTGYFEPELEASLTPNPEFPAPIYGLPADLRSTDLGRFHPRWTGQTLIYRQTDEGIEPYFSRQDIDTHGALKATPIAWVRDPVDVYFLQVQGSGRLRLPDGSLVHVLYAGKNGREYVSLGRVLLERALLSRPHVSMQSIRAFLRVHPEQQEELLNQNPSYVFFRLADNGPFGAMGRTLTPGVSMATDSAFLPLGALLAVDANLPTPGGQRQTRFLGLAQDRGGAITGSRLDLFCGAGADAEFLAGHLQDRSRVFLLLKKQD